MYPKGHKRHEPHRLRFHLPSTSDKLRKSEFWAVDNVSFEVKRGECLGIIGRNGAGKSTLLKMLNGIILPDKGKITIKGKVGALIDGKTILATCKQIHNEKSS